ncbi:MAG: hypothetical protein Rhob2KO_14470 [Rhodopirellula baltica]
MEAKRHKAKGDEGSLLGPFLDAYVKGRTDLKKGTVTNYKQARRLLCEHFGERKTLRSITPADADRFRRWLLSRPVKWDSNGKPIETMATATVSKHIKRTKTMFAEAVRDRLLAESPFADQKGSSEANSDRHYFIDLATTATILKACPDHDWKMIFGLARFGGLRCPSEVTRIRWSDVQFDAGRLRIDSPKTGLRFCSLFPELRAILEAAAAERENDLVMNRRLVSGYGVDANLATHLRRIIERAGVVPWPKTFINLRSTRRTELQEEFPSQVVNAWLGHSSKTAEDHYLQVTQGHWDRGSAFCTAGAARDEDSAGGVTGGDTPATLQPSGAMGRHEKTRKAQGSAGSRSLAIAGKVTPTGLEPVLPP